MKKCLFTLLAVLGLSADASACSQARFPRARGLVARLIPAQPVFPRLRAVVAPVRLVGLSGGCVPVFAPAAPAVELKPVPKELPKK